MSVIKKISTTSPLSPKEVLVLDTNVILWTFYSHIAPRLNYQTKIYPTFIANAIAQRNMIIVTTFSLNEVLHVIEKTEYALYKKRTGATISLKDYRNLPAERAKVKNEIELILKQLKAIPSLSIVKSKATRKTINQFVYHFHAHLADFFDFCLLNYCNNHGYAVVSDDRDFNTPFCKGKLYSANPKL